MKTLVLAEMLKIRSTRTTLGLVVATLALVPLTVTVSVPPAATENPPVALDDPSLLADAVGNSFGVPLVLVLLLGGFAFTQEFRYGTVTSTYLVEPGRTRVLVAKWVASALASVAVTTATLVVSVPYAIALIAYRDGAVHLGAQFWEMAAAGYVVMAAFAIIGVAIGALLRNQITAVVVVLVWMLAVEQIVVTSYPSVGRWFPGATTWVLLQLGASVDPAGELLSAPASALLLTAYVAMAVVLAVRLTPKRDVL